MESKKGEKLRSTVLTGMGLLFFLIPGAFEGKAQTGPVTPPPIIPGLTNRGLVEYPFREDRSNAENLIVLIHGWNPGGNHNSFADGALGTLLETISLELQNTPTWNLAAYHWEKDAATGLNPTQAAINGERLGRPLGGTILVQYQKLKRVHLIAHSAGTWVAEQCIRRLLRDSGVQIQLTLLDPFIPEITSKLNRDRISSLGGTPENWKPESRIYRLENYYSFDLSGPPTQWVFEWSQRDVNYRVEEGGHAGPIDFFTKSVSGTVSDFGWPTSMFFREPVFDEDYLISVRKNVSEEAFFAVRARPRKVGTANPPEMTFEWEYQRPDSSRWDPIVGTDSAPLTGTSFRKIVSEVDHGTKIQVRATYDFLSNESSPVFLWVNESPDEYLPVAPENIRLHPVSQSEIEITWTSTDVENVSFVVQRKISGSFRKVGEVFGVSGKTNYAFRESGLRADTNYAYRIVAHRAGRPGAPSGVYFGRTPGPAVGTEEVTVVAHDIGAGESLGIEISSWIEGGAGYRTNQTGFTRHFSHGSRVFLSAPGSLSGGRYFRRWFLHDGRTSEHTTIDFDVRGDMTAVAVYSSEAPPVKALDSLSIVGSSSVPEGGTESYRALARFEDGSRSYVQPVWSENSSHVHLSSNGTLDAGAVPSDTDVDISASYTSGGVTRSATKTVTVRDRSGRDVFTLDTNSSGSGFVNVTPRAGTYEDGTEVTLRARPDSGQSFSHWSGDLSGSVSPITITMDRDRSITAHFVEDTGVGAINVFLSPPGANADGAGWKYDLFTAWRTSGDEQRNLSPRTGRYVRFKEIPGWIAPESVRVDIVGGQTSIVNAAYREIGGSLQVVIEPGEAVAAGAAWRIAGGAWNESGTALNNLSQGAYTVEFKPVTGWGTPPSQSVSVTRGNPTILGEAYGVSDGTPLISGIVPNTGPLEGGTEITITGANFSPGATVRFGGHAATPVTFVNGGELEVTLPPGDSYGSVTVTVDVGARTARKINGFAYDIPLGTNMTLLGQIGGTVNAVDASGSLVVYGEGNGLVAADFLHPSSPVVRDRIALPGQVLDIKIRGGLAYVANGVFGLQVVDVSNPASLSRVGFYDTAGYAVDVELDGNLAFVADQETVEVIDISDPSSLRRIATFDPGWAHDLSLIHTGSRRILAVAGDSAGVHVIDADDPLAMVPLTTLLPGSQNYKISADGTNLLMSRTSGGSNFDGVIFDLSDPENPVLTDVIDDQFYSGTPLFRNGIIYKGDSDLRVYRSPYSSSVRVELDGSTRDLALSGSMLYVASHRYGLFAVNVANPSSPYLRSRINQSFGAGDVVVSGDTAYIAFGGSYSHSSVGGVPMMTAVDVSDKSKPRRLGTANWDSTVDRLIRSGGYIHCVTQTDGIVTFYMGNPSNPFLQSERFEDRTIYAASTQGSRLVLAGVKGGNQNLSLVSGNNTDDHTIHSDYNFASGPGWVSGVATNGDHVYVLTSNDALRIFDYSNVYNPQPLGELNYPVTVRYGLAVSADGNFVYSANGTDGLTVFDCTDRSAPQVAATYTRDPGFISGTAIAIQGSLVFHGNERGVSVLDCTDPYSPVLVANFDTPGRPYAIYPAGNHVYVADGNTGMQILELGDLSRPLIEITSPTRNSSLEVTATTIDLGGNTGGANEIARVVWSNDRGGGGIANGTANWSIDDVFLRGGTNIITVTAEDSNGNTTSDSITVVAATPDVTPPIVQINSPTADDALVVRDGVVTLSGTADDDRSVSEIHWFDNWGNQGVAQKSGKSWSVADAALNPGVNEFTICAFDEAGNEGIDKLAVIHRLPDDIAPTVEITFPTDTQSIDTRLPYLQLSGVADDNFRVERIEWRNFRGGSGVAAGTRQWVADDIRLSEGINLISVTAIDVDGNRSEDSLTVDYDPMVYDLDYPDLVVGKDFDLQLEWPFEGARYTVRGLPRGLRFDRNTGRISGRFSRGGNHHVRIWVKSVGGRSGPFTIPLNVSGLPIEATGAFQAILGRSLSINGLLGGELRLKIAGSGGFSGVLTNGGSEHRFRSTLSVDMTDDVIGNPVADFDIVRGDLAPLNVTFEIDLQTGGLTGQISDGDEIAPIQGYRKDWHHRSNPALEYRGRYHSLIDLDTGQGLAGLREVPQGIGFERIVVDSHGRINRSCRLADGTRFTDGSYLGGSGEFQLHRILYRRNGSVIGTGGFQEDPDNDQNYDDNRVNGNWSWLKTGASSKKDLLYSGGFHDGGVTPVQLVQQGARWKKPTRDENLLSMMGEAEAPGNFRLVFTYGGVEAAGSGSPDLVVTLDDGNRILLPERGTAENPAWVKARLNPSNGAITGSFQVFDEFPAGSGNSLRRIARFQGLLVPDFGLGAGFFHLPELPESPDLPLRSSPRLSGMVVLEPND